MENLIAQINDLKISYSIHGEGYPLTLLHGFAMYKEFWNWQIKDLSKSFKTITLDFRGCGNSDHPKKNFTMQDLATDVKGLLDHLNIEQTHIAGHSFGGMVAQHFALKYPEKLNKLILMATFAHLPLSKSGIEMYKKSQLDFYEKKLKDPSAAFWDKMKQRFSRVFYKEMVQNPDKKLNNFFISSDLMNLENKNGTSEPQDILNMIQAIEHHNTLDQLNQIKNETLILAGDKDKVVPKLSCQVIREKLPNSVLKVLKSSHFFMLEEISVVNDLIFNFLKS